MWFKKMPDVVLTHYWSDGKPFDQKLARSFYRDGKRWCKWRGEYVLLKDDGTCVGASSFPMSWEAV